MKERRRPVVKREDVDAAMNGGSGALESILIRGFVTMPKNVRVLLYSALFITFLYTQLLLPTLVTGRIVNVESPDKMLIGRVHYWIGNNRSSTEINPSTGSWSVPMFWRIPKEIKIEVQIAKAASTAVTISFWTVLKSSLTLEPIEIRASRMPGRGASDFRLEVVTKERSVRSIWNSWPEFPTATAEDELLSKPEKIAERSVGQEVLGVARKSVGDVSISLSDQIASRLKNPLDQSNFFQTISAKYNVYISLSTIERTRTFGELADAVTKKIEFQERLAPRVREVLSKHRKVDGVWASGGTVPPFKLNNFYASQQGVPKAEQTSLPLGFLDATVFGSGSEGILFGNTGIFYRTDWTVSSGPRSGFVPYEEFARRKFGKGGWFEVSFDFGQNFVTAGAGVGRSELVGILSEIQREVAAANQKPE